MVTLLFSTLLLAAAIYFLPLAGPLFFGSIWAWGQLDPVYQDQLTVPLVLVVGLALCIDLGVLWPIRRRRRAARLYRRQVLADAQRSVDISREADKLMGRR